LSFTYTAEALGSNGRAETWARRVGCRERSRKDIVPFVPVLPGQHDEREEANAANSRSYSCLEKREV
jgi:hypothetical protein